MPLKPPGPPHLQLDPSRKQFRLTADGRKRVDEVAEALHVREQVAVDLLLRRGGLQDAIEEANQVLGQDMRVLEAHEGATAG